MQNRKVTANVTLVNHYGLHMRPATLVAEIVKRHLSEVQISYADQQVNCRNLIDILMLSARQGAEIIITAEGEDAEAVVVELVELVRNGFGEMESETPAGQPGSTPK